MIYTDMTNKALKIMFDKHKNQVDKAGVPYVFHPFHVAESMPNEDTTCVALLHDTIEDTDLTLEDLKKEGFNDNVLSALSLMTHTDDMDYYDYVARLSLNPISATVKISDLNHNSDISRLTNVDDAAIQRLEKYKVCIEFLKSQLLLLQNGKIDDAILNSKNFVTVNKIYNSTVKK